MSEIEPKCVCCAVENKDCLCEDCSKDINMAVDNGSKYFHTVKGMKDGKIDIYSVAHTFNLTAGRFHAVKKILCAGKRGIKSEVQDLQEAITALQREIEICNS